MKKNLHLFFLSFLVLYKLCIIKIYLCTKDFFCLFLFYFFFFLTSWDGGGYMVWMAGEGPSLPWLLPSLWRWRETARGGKRECGELGAPPACAPWASPGASKGEGWRLGWRRSPLVGFRGVSEVGREQPKSFLRSLPDKGRDEHMGVCLNCSSLAKPRDAVIQEQVPASGLLPLPVLVASSVHFHVSQISGFWLRICLQARQPSCMFLSFLRSVCDLNFWGQQVTHAQGLEPMGTFPTTEQVTLKCHSLSPKLISFSAIPK